MTNFKSLLPTRRQSNTCRKAERR